jgi:hypothetical protein
VKMNNKEDNCGDEVSLFAKADKNIKKAQAR